jgi:hypothetical protein
MASASGVQILRQWAIQAKRQVGPKIVNGDPRVAALPLAAVASSFYHERKKGIPHDENSSS